jgi:hypothetical protein
MVIIWIGFIKINDGWNLKFYDLNNRYTGM